MVGRAGRPPTPSLYLSTYTLHFSFCTSSTRASGPSIQLVPHHRVLHLVFPLPDHDVRVQIDRLEVAEVGVGAALARGGRGGVEGRGDGVGGGDAAALVIALPYIQLLGPLGGEDEPHTTLPQPRRLGELALEAGEEGPQLALGDDVVGAVDRLVDDDDDRFAGAAGRPGGDEGRTQERLGHLVAHGDQVGGSQAGVADLGGAAAGGGEEGQKDQGGEDSLHGADHKEF